MDNSLSGKRIALVGGGGFIGHHMALQYAADGAEVAVIDSFFVNNVVAHLTPRTSSNPVLYSRMLTERLRLLQNEKRVTIFPEDARDYLRLSKAISEFQPHVVVHLAAIAHAAKANKDPFRTYDHSFRTLENALDASRDRVEHFIFFSSSMAYGNFRSTEVTEEHPLDPISIYGALKAGGEKLVIAYGHVFNMPYTIIRPSALYGPRCVSRRVVQIFIENAFAGQNLEVQGDGSEKLDFTYIDDLVDGIRRTMLNEKAKGQVFNMTNGAGRSLNDLAIVIQQHFPEIQIEHVERDKLVPIRGTLCIDKARSRLGYNPQNSLEVGVPKYIENYRHFMQEPSEGIIA